MNIKGGVMTAREDQQSLIEIEKHVHEWLRKRRVPSTIRNVIHALADQFYIDWTGDDVVPLCLPETWWQAVLRFIRWQ